MNYTIDMLSRWCRQRTSNNNVFHVTLMLCFFVACTRQPLPNNCPEKYGLELDTTYDDIVERAVIYADVILDRNVHERVQFAGSHSPLYPDVRFAGSPDVGPSGIRYDQTYASPAIEFSHYRPVPVHVVEEGQLSDAENTFVP